MHTATLSAVVVARAALAILDDRIRRTEYPPRRPGRPVRTPDMKLLGYLRERAAAVIQMIDGPLKGKVIRADAAGLLCAVASDHGEVMGDLEDIVPAATGIPSWDVARLLEAAATSEDIP